MKITEELVEVSAAEIASNPNYYHLRSSRWSKPSIVDPDIVLWHKIAPYKTIGGYRQPLCAEPIAWIWNPESILGEDGVDVAFVSGKGRFGCLYEAFVEVNREMADWSTLREISETNYDGFINRGLLRDHCHRHIIDPDWFRKYMLKMFFKKRLDKVKKNSHIEIDTKNLRRKANG